MAKVCLPGRPGDGSMLHGDPSVFLTRVWEMCLGDGPFCDLQLQFGDETRQGGNSLVLAALSPFFEAMLTTEMKEKTGHVVQLPTISQRTFRQVLAFSLGREVGVEEREELEYREVGVEEREVEEREVEEREVGMEEREELEYREVGVEEREVEEREVGVEEREVGVEEREVGVEDREVGLEEREMGVEEREVRVEEREVGVEDREVGLEEREVGVEEREVRVEEKEMGLGGREGELVELLQAADMLQLWHLKNACGEALADRLTKDNCLDTLKLVHKFSLHEVKLRTEEYVAYCLDQVYECHGWPSLEEAEVRGVIKVVGPCTASMDTKAAAVLRWLQENRADVDATSRLVGLLSLEELSFDFMLDSLLMHPCVLQCPSVLQAVKECMKAKAAAGPKQETITTPLVQACVEIAPAPVSYIFFFNNDNNRLEICEWLTKEQVWVNCLDRYETLLSCTHEESSGQLILSTKPLVQFGSDSKFLHYSVKGRTISHEGATRSGLSHLAGAVGDSVFVVDGKNVSRYNVKSKDLGKIGSLLANVSNPEVAIKGDLLLVVGGRGENCQNNLIQTFHTKTYKASVSAHRLPKDMTCVTFAGHHQGRSYFLGTRGDLVGLVERQGEVMVDTHVQLEDFQPRGDFGVCIAENSVTVCANCSRHIYMFSGQRRQTFLLPNLSKTMTKCCVIPMFEHFSH